MLTLATIGLAAILVPSPLPPKPASKPIPWSVTPVAIIRTAATVFDPDRKPYLDWLSHRAGLQVLLRFNGPEKIRAFTGLRIIHAGLNTGVNLHVLSPATNTFVLPDRTRLDRMARAAALPGRILPVLLSLPSIKAKVLTRFAGRCSLVVGGHSRLVELKHIQSMRLGPVALPAGLFPRIRLALLHKPKPGTKGLLALQLSGAPDAFESASVVTGHHRISHGSLVLGSLAGPQKILLFLSQPSSPDSELKLHLRSGQKMLIVKFSLRPIKLPQ